MNNPHAAITVLTSRNRRLEAMTGAQNSPALPPWAPLTPAEESAIQFPDNVTTEWVAALDDTPLGELYLRAHIRQRPANGDPNYAARWRRYWRALSFDERRRRRTIGRLLAWREDAEKALIPDPEDYVIKRFLNQINDAINRVNKDSTETPLAWAGSMFASWPRRMSSMVEDLAVAIDEFHQGNLTLDELRNYTIAKGVCPDTHRTPVSEATRARVVKEAKRPPRST